MTNKFNATMVFDMLVEYITHRNDLNVQNSNGVSLDAQDILWGFIHSVDKRYDELKSCYRTMPRYRYRVLSDAVKFREITKEISRNIVHGRSWDVSSLDLFEPDISRDLIEFVISEIEAAIAQKVPMGWDKIEPDSDIVPDSEEKEIPAGWDLY